MVMNALQGIAPAISRLRTGRLHTGRVRPAALSGLLCSLAAAGECRQRLDAFVLLHAHGSSAAASPCSEAQQDPLLQVAQVVTAAIRAELHPAWIVATLDHT